MSPRTPRTKGLPAALRPRLIRELDQEILVAVRKTRELHGVAEAVVAQLRHFWQREGLSVRTLGAPEALASALAERLDRFHGLRGLGAPGAPPKFDGAWMLAEIDRVAALRWEGQAATSVPVRVRALLETEITAALAHARGQGLRPMMAAPRVMASVASALRGSGLDALVAAVDPTTHAGATNAARMERWLAAHASDSASEAGAEASALVALLAGWLEIAWDERASGAGEGGGDTAVVVRDPRVAGAAEADFRAYRPSERYAEGELVRHAKFGNGRVRRVLDAGKIEVEFADGVRALAQGVGG